MATTLSSLATPHSLHRRCFRSPAPASFSARFSFRASPPRRAAARARRRAAVQVLSSSAVMEAPEELATRKLYVGNIPRTVTNDELRAMFADHGTVLRAETSPAMAAAASLLLTSAAPSFPIRSQLPTAAAARRLSIPASENASLSCSIRSRRPTVRRNAAETYVPGSGKYVAPDYLVKKVTAKELEELVRGERKVPLIVDFYATWCGPCVLMAQDIEMLAVDYDNNALFVKVDTDDEYEFARDMQVRGLPTLYFFSPDQSKDAIRTEGLIPIDMIRNIIENKL